MSLIESPYDPNGKIWVRGQLHTHTTRSDGADDPQTTIDHYAARGYDFLMLSDHDTFGTYDGLDGHGMILIQGNELSQGPHMLHVAAKSHIPSGDHQAAIDAINAEGGFVICNHPNWLRNFNHFPQELLDSLNGYVGIEIYNGVIRRLQGSEIATDRWDRLLSAGRRIWGFGNDDAHRPEGVGIAWNMAWVPEQSHDAIINALRSGSFYASTGVIITDIAVYGEFIRIKTANAKKIIASTADGKRSAEVNGREMVYRIQNSDSDYVRFTAIGDPDQYAFTQPFFIVCEREDIPPGERIQYTVERTDKPVAVTGNLDDPAWGAVEPMQRLRNPRSMQPSPFSPDVKILTDGHTLFIGLTAVEPNPGDWKLNSGENGDSRIWSDDGVELFVDPSNSRDGYYQIMINAAGVMTVVGHNRPEPADGITVKAGKREYAYTLEIAIPMDSLPNAKPEGTWAFNIVRNKMTPPKDMCQWSITGDNNHNPDRFGEILFE